MKKVALVGFSLLSRGGAPFEDTSIEMWGLNEGYIRPFPRIDRWFQLHSYQSFTRADNANDPNHYAWLRQARDFPIYMQKKFPQIPASVEYPLEEIKERYGTYMTSSFAYMILLAIHEGYEWIGIYGFDMATGTEYAHQKPNAEYLIGLARGMGIHIELPESSSLLRGKMYAYEDDSIGMRQNFEFREGVLRGQFEKVEKDFYVLQGRSAVLEEIVAKKIKPSMELLRTTQQELLNASALANVINGARKENELMQKIYDGFAGTKAVQDELEKEIE